MTSFPPEPIIRLYRSLRRYTQLNFPAINERYVADYLDLLAVGATHDEAVHQVALQNEVDRAEVQTADAEQGQ